MAVLAKVSTLREQLPSVTVDLSLYYCCTARQALAALRSLCTEGCVRTVPSTCVGVCNVIYMDCSYALYSARNFGHFFDANCSYIIMIVSALYVCLFHVQLLCWGVRDMKSFLLQSVNSPTVEVRCGDVQFTQTLHIKDASKNPNFPGPRPFIIQDMVLNYCSKINPKISVCAYV